MVEENSIYQQKEFNRKVSKRWCYFYGDFLASTVNEYGDKSPDKAIYLLQLLKEEEKLSKLENEYTLKKALEKIVVDRKHIELSKALSLEQNKINIHNIDFMDPLDFEKFIMELYKEKGYSAKLTSINGDQGCDVILDKFGERTVVQVKRYNNLVGNKAVQEIVAAKAFYDASKAMVITNNYFTSSAQQLGKANNVELVDRIKLIALI